MAQDALSRCRRELDVTLRQGHRLLTSEHRQQYLDALVWFHAGVQSEKPLEWPAWHPHARADLHTRRLRYLDSTADFTTSDLVNHLIRNPRRRHPVHDQSSYADAPARAMPLLLDHNEGVCREQRRSDYDSPAA
jgi:hypothetical protein